MTRAIVVGAGDAAAVATALGYPTPCYNAATGQRDPSTFSLRHRDVEKDDQGRDVLVVDGVEAALTPALRARVVDVTRAVAAAIAEELP